MDEKIYTTKDAPTAPIKENSAQDLKPIEEMTPEELIEELNRALLDRNTPQDIWEELRAINKELLQEVANDQAVSPEKKKIAKGMAKFLEEGADDTPH
jgi:hypothetical protein